MRTPAKQSTSNPRGKRAGVAAPAVPSVEMRKRDGASNARRRSPEAHADEWRRIEMGTNHIACFGGWRRGARLQAGCVNRSGTTRWHMPHRTGVAFTLAGAAHEAVNEA